jgi:hypothetical protein
MNRFQSSTIDRQRGWATSLSVLGSLLRLKSSTNYSRRSDVANDVMT